MPSSFNNISATDWRQQLRRNERRTMLVIVVFIAIYMLLGLLLDVYFYPHLNVAPITYSQILTQLLTFQVVPKLALLLGVIAVASVMITFALHDKIMLLGTEYYEITPKTARNLAEQKLYNVIEELKIAAGLHFMPKIYVIEADYMNAFASGYSEKSALVAITRGLMEKLDRSELQAVMAHELSHIRHHDIKLTLMASVLSNIILIVIDLLFRGIIFGGGDRRRREGNGLEVAIVILRFLLPLITVLLLLYLSRTREYMADAGAVELMRDNSPLAKALLKISQDHEANSDKYAVAYLSTPHEDVRREAYIFDPTQIGISIQRSISSMFSTHPLLEDRLRALGWKN